MLQIHLQVMCPRCGSDNAISPSSKGQRFICWRCDEKIALSNVEVPDPGVHVELNTACDKQWFMDRYGDWWEVMWVLSGCGYSGPV